MPTLSSFRQIIPFLLLGFFAFATQAQVPANQTFKFINEGEFGDRIIEYDASYRVIRNDVYTFYTFPFRLCFYNTTPDAYIFTIRAGIPNDEGVMRWVWDANRHRPVRENATLSFGRDGNLVLVDVDAHVAWQTNTANKGVTGIKLLPNGNLVLHDKNGRFVWQSFDHPTDTLLVGQSVRING
ncbi:EP1-like glycoprotein 2 [Alnus glutinosa]|uniref:EP1-like glycoprotein 2 n=1 Tax=Alnus glutinosa TaxID=3517 RepID=UPI002D76D297|nr:EP1-like glycoprotein 2 [Alnus glutinosa]